MSHYSYEACLERSYKINWRIGDVLDGRSFDPDREWLPRALSGAGQLEFLDAREKRQLTHLEMAAYAHLFGYAEEFVAPTIVELARDFQVDQRPAFDALTNFAAEEVKHMNLFRRIRNSIDQDLGFELELLGDQQATTRYVLSKKRGGVLLLTACIEWFTQRHYQECFRDDNQLDPFTRRIFKCHWLEESQHAQMDHLETVRVFEAMDVAERDEAIDDLIELLAAFDGLLQTQAACDTRNFQAYLDRELDADEIEQVHEHVLRAKRHTFLVTGVTHPEFLKLLVEVTTPEQQLRVNEALHDLLPVLAQA
jgi:hypothetical protein